MQQVNLYLPELRPRRDWLNAQFAAVVCGALIVLMVIVQLVASVRANALEAEVARQEQAVAELRTKVDRLKQASSAVGNPSFEDTIAQLEASIANRQKVGRILAGQNVGNARGFYANMQSLAQESQGDLALDRFTFSRGGSYVEMHGQARNAGAVPLYLQRLKRNPVFSQARFGLLSASSESSDNGTIEFALGYDNIYAPQPAGGKR